MKLRLKPSESIYFEIDNYIVTAGRIIPEKGFDLLIDSFNLLIDKSLKLVILGMGTNKEKQKLVNQIETLGLQNRVILYGFAKNVYSYF